MRRKSGIAIVATLVILVLVGLLVFGTFYTTQIEQFVTRNDATSTQANYIAQAGLQKYKTALFQNFRWALGQPAANVGACENPLYLGIDWDRNGPGPMQTFNSQGQMVFTENVAGGQATVTIRRDANDPNYMTITSVGRFAGAQSSVRAVFNLANAGLLRYAVVAGGVRQESINGNARIRGGVFIEGDQSNPERRVFAGSGNLEISNNYDLAGSQGNAFLSSRVSPVQTNNLCASFRVRWGTIGLTGSAGLGRNGQNLVDIKIGDPSLVPNYPSLALAYNNQGIIQNQTCANGFCAPFVGRYDITDAESPRFPRLDDSGTCGAGLSWRTCIRNDARGVILTRGEALPPMPTTGLPTGATWSDANSCSSFLNQATITLNNTAYDCRVVVGSTPIAGFRYQPNGQLEVYGTTVLQGFNIVFDRAISYSAYGYNQTGNRAAALLLESRNGSGGNITFNANFGPDGTARFPQQTLALLAEGNPNPNDNFSVLYGNNNVAVAALIYSGKTFAMSGSQSALAGMAIVESLCANTTGNANNRQCGGQGASDIFYVDPGFNLPGALAAIPGTRVAAFQILSYERF
ncbi:MAG: hypothetical protein RMK51_09520 [Meiothermus sp.]|uniref:hypothetical protein n=1 Tax=Meiothermus sp. TaxID=1955249 RepID=UPI0025E73C80|nr:hypothetical protein [Meiothermus sp.]MCS7069493.1 hypothetical protein [Meiothermus sp.]MDW8426160.1 hypothetical protein [Meiothermus sp.]